MTQTLPGDAAAQLPAQPPVQSHDLVAARKAQEAQVSAVSGAAMETKQWTGTLSVGPSEFPQNRRSYTLVPSLSAYAMVSLQEAQDGGKLREIIVAIKELVVPDQQQDLVDFMLDPSPAEGWAMTVEDCIDVLSDGMEQIAARPRSK